MVLAVLVLTVFVGRLVQVQIFQGPALAARAQEERITSSVEVAHRGDIVDANGRVLATSVDRYTISADTLAIQSFQGGQRVDAATGRAVQDGALGIAQLLAPILDEQPAELAAKLNGDDRYVILQRNAVPEVQRAIAKLDLQAYVRTELTSRRTYPAGVVAGTLVGYVDRDQVGQGGLERAYEDVLAGTDGKVVFERGRDGVQIPNSEQESTPAVPGGDVVLTIDADVQWKAEELIDDAVSKSGSAYGIAVVQDVRDGTVLAVADSGDVDPNDRSTSAVANGSRAVKDVFEPGSTGKVITMAAALEEGYWAPDSQFEVPYRFTTPNGESFKDSHEHPLQRLTLAGVLAHSSNTGTVQIGEKIPLDVRHDYLGKFGFGQQTGLGLPGESAGIVPSEQTLANDSRTPYTILFGQGVAVNAMQATQVFSTVANGGVRVEPSLVAGTRDAEGTFSAADAPTETRVVSEKTADSVMRMMESVVGEEGTAANARVPGYRVAGKTGTAQMWLPGGGTTYMASFIGVAPADDPRYTVSVFLRSPQSSIYGGVVAAPVFSDLMGYTLQKMDVPPSTTPADPYDLTW
ncbi:cell division protein FtsI (penicillin-binding protein 3) [Krasilnikoviella flava]|uniref:Cell division protein FtsI (Penicillin-binding protein 3) n=2 Tax=Krasilnikoviella flava TaxID=526729 RepID=A0A1T5LU08_9MICO|nr:cell division protein FtsI (penicillin-binding protein 3) [Krasilnikoviella flava]